MNIINFRFLVVNGRWKPSIVNYVQVVGSKKAVVFEAIKTRILFFSLLNMFKFMGKRMLPVLLLDPHLANIHRSLYLFSRFLLIRRLLVLYRWPSGLLTNYFIVLPNIMNLLHRIGPQRSAQRRVSVLFPFEVPFLSVVGDQSQNTALLELNLLSVPTSVFLSSNVNFEAQLNVTYPIFFNSKNLYNRLALYKLLTLAYYKPFVQTCIIKRRRIKMLERRIAARKKRMAARQKIMDELIAKRRLRQQKVNPNFKFKMRTKNRNGGIAQR